MKPEKNHHTPILNLMIQWTLGTGLVISLLLMGAGTILFLLHPGNQAIHTMPLHAILSGLVTANPLAFLLAGIIILMLTPAMRVLIAALGYLLEGDWLFAVVSAVVLLVLALSLSIGAS